MRTIYFSFSIALASTPASEISKSQDYGLHLDHWTTGFNGDTRQPLYEGNTGFWTAIKGKEILQHEFSNLFTPGHRFLMTIKIKKFSIQVDLNLKNVFELGHLLPFDSLNQLIIRGDIKIEDFTIKFDPTSNTLPKVILDHPDLDEEELETIRLATESHINAMDIQLARIDYCLVTTRDVDKELETISDCVTTINKRVSTAADY